MSVDITDLRRHRRQLGFSILEVMVALFISLLMLAAVIAVFVNTRQSFDYQRGINTLNDNIRFAVQTMSRELRMAGHWAGASSAPTLVAADSAARNSIRQCLGFSQYLQQVLDDAASGRQVPAISVIAKSEIPASPVIPGGDACLNRDSLVAETDVLSLNYVIPQAIPDGDVGTAGIGGFGIYQRTRVGFAPELLAIPATLSSYGPGHELEGVPNLAFTSVSYGVSNCASLADSGCTGMRRLLRVTNGFNSAQSLVSPGVEAMSFLMQVDQDRDGTNINFLNAADLMAETGLGNNPYDAVTAVSVSMVVRSEERDIAFASNPSSYVMPGANYTPQGRDRNFPRRLVTFTVELRNNRQ